MKRIAFGVVVLLVSIMTQICQAQQFDVAFGVGTVGTMDDNKDPNFPTLRGGAYPAFSADFLFRHNLGIQGEVAWRGSSAVFQNTQPYRPIFYEFNGIWAPMLGNRVGIEAMGGIGGLSTRVYQPFFTCSFTGCTNYLSSNHFLGHIGGGVNLYVKGPFFIRPEAHIYFINNNVDYQVPRATRYGISIGYTMRNEQP